MTGEQYLLSRGWLPYDAGRGHFEFTHPDMADSYTIETAWAAQERIDAALGRTVWAMPPGTTLRHTHRSGARTWFYHVDSRTFVEGATPEEALREVTP